ncbi:AI-2E family transporter [Sporolactobacillus spathodeae]|uniref:PurR-regulated permease PerM n=1 Tax=Sporolactobacillus spathodeae TaxID=1465502 RepID=A0ABS2Q7G2_9BACL|nr:AI-2E family transporter [Sporolactobacillus spathodeae]MBM7657114.1 putative PurR-regulated permease PerM [Sporolactobacillus spathodeae]
MLKKHGSIIFWTIELLGLALLIFVLTKISFIFIPVVTLITTFFFPILVAGFLFFLLSPFVGLLERLRLPRALSIAIIYLILIGLITLLVVTFGPTLGHQVKSLFSKLPDYIVGIRHSIDQLANTQGFKWLIHQDYYSIDKIQKNVTNMLNDYSKHAGSSFSSFFSVIVNLTLTVVTVPFILFYMLKDGDRLPSAVMRFFPRHYHHEVNEIIQDLSSTLSSYIHGLIIVATFVGATSSIGFAAIGLPYSLLLGLIVGVTNIIPYMGPILGAAPAIIVASMDSPVKALFVLVIIVTVQQLDGHLISPLVMGKRLNIHPLTIIVLLLVAGKWIGPIGMILAVPSYAMAKTVIMHAIRLIRLRRQSKDDTLIKDE